MWILKLSRKQDLGVQWWITDSAAWKMEGWTLRKMGLLFPLFRAKALTFVPFVLEDVGFFPRVRFPEEPEGYR
jgi:hypothetical protein